MVRRSCLFAVGFLAARAFGAPDAHAVTLGEALAAEQFLQSVDGLAPAERPAFLAAHRAQLGQALMVRQILITIGHTVDVTAMAAQRVYHTSLLCGPVPPEDDDSDELGRKAPLPVPPILEMAAAFKADIKKSLNLPENAATEARLNQIDVTDVIANRMLDSEKCTSK